MGNQQESTGRINPARSVGPASPESPNAGDASMSASPSVSSFAADMEYGGAGEVDSAQGGGLVARVPELAVEEERDGPAGSISPNQVNEGTDGDRLAMNDHETAESDFRVEEATSEEDDVEGLDNSSSWGDYPIDEILIRHESRSVFEVMRRIDNDQFIMHPDFQRDFVWSNEKQSKLIESVVMRIPLPVFYLAQNKDGRMVVVDGLQRLSTFQNFTKDKLRLRLSNRAELDKKLFSELAPVYKNRIEDCNLEVYIIDHKVPERARLDIFERVNGGEQLTRQQMRNSLFNGRATRFLRDEAQSREFKDATGRSLNRKKMRDREFINRFCAFHILGLDEYRGDMDVFLANCLRVMNEKNDEFEQNLRIDFRRGLRNNFLLFGEHAFRKYEAGQDRRNMINAALWDVMSTELSKYEENVIMVKQEQLRSAIYKLLLNEDFKDTISSSTGDTKQVKKRFGMVQDTVSEVLS